MKKYDFIPPPHGGLDFAIFPAIEHPIRSFARAPVRLQQGDARWGRHHIELAHSKEMARLKMDSVIFIASILKPGNPIYCEFESVKKIQRTQSVNLRIGTAILEYKRNAYEDFYTVITAFSRREPLGELIGRLE